MHKDALAAMNPTNAPLPRADPAIVRRLQALLGA